MNSRPKTAFVLILVLTAVISFMVSYQFFGNDLGKQSDLKTVKLTNTMVKLPSNPINVSKKLLPPTEKVVMKYETPTLDSLTKALTFVMNLKSTESKVYSQNLEDGVLDAIFKKIGVKYKYYVEFGVEDGRQCNTRFFREKYGWRGLLMDGGHYKPDINLQKEMIFPTNIVQLFRKYNVPKNFDLLSVDTDFKDFWLMQKILSAGYRPRVIISEINSFLGPKAGKTVPIDFAETRGDFSQYYGFSVTAGWHLGRYYGYSMVYCETAGVNCMWVIDGPEGFGKGIQISNYVNGSSLWHGSCCLPHKPDRKGRPYTIITSENKFN